MSNVVNFVPAREAAQETGSALLEAIVQMMPSDAQCFIVATASGQFRAQRAAGCLLKPEIGDHVLIARTAENHWVLAVLARNPECPGVLSLPDETRIEARRLVFFAEALDLGGRLLTQSFDYIRTRAIRMSEAVCRRHGQYGKLREETADTKEVETGRLRVDCKKSARLRAENLDVRAQELLTMDAEHIKLG